MEVPRLGVQLELLLPPYTTATATPTWDLSLVFHLQHSSLQCQILNPLREARDRTYVLMDTSQIAPHPRWMPLITWSSQAKDQIRAEDLSTSCGNARSPTHCAGLGIKPVSWCSQDAAGPVAPQWELLGGSSYGNLKYFLHRRLLASTVLSTQGGELWTPLSVQLSLLWITCPADSSCLVRLGLNLSLSVGRLPNFPWIPSPCAASWKPSKQ